MRERTERERHIRAVLRGCLRRQKTELKKWHAAHAILLPCAACHAARATFLSKFFCTDKQIYLNVNLFYKRSRRVLIEEEERCHALIVGVLP